MFQCEVFTPAGFYKRNGIPMQADLDKEAAVKHQKIMQSLRGRDEEIDTITEVEEAEHASRRTQMEKEWQSQLNKNLKLKETYEGLMKSGIMDRLPQLGEDAMAEIKYDEDEDDWSNDDSSVVTVEMDKMVEGEENQMMGNTPESSNIEGWSLSESDGESDIDSEG